MEILDATEDPRDGEFEWQDDRLVFYEYVPTLLEMSSFAVALDIWNSWVPRTSPLDHTTFSGSIIRGYLDESKKFVADLRIPRLVAEMITKDLDTISYEILRLRHEIFDELSPASLYRIVCVDSKQWLSWRWQLKPGIDARKTAINILSDSELKEVEKFTVMCEFCLVDEIEKVSLSSLPAVFVKNMDFSKNPLVFYWICYLQNQMYKIRFQGFASIDAMMASRNHGKIFAFEYFWDRLNDNDKLTETMRLFDSKFVFGYKYVEKFVSKMTQYQQDRLFSEYFVAIMRYFWFDLRKPKCAVSIWMRVRDRCTVDQFNFFVKYILIMLIRFETDMNLLIDVWNTAPDNLKSNFAERDANGTLISLIYSHHKFEGSRTPALNSYKFFQQVFSTKIDSYRDEMRNIAAHVAPVYSNSLIMIDVLKLCWPFENERIQFSQTVFESRETLEHVVSLIEKQKFAEVSEMLTNYSLPADFIGSTMEWVLVQSNLNRMIFMCNYELWLKLSEFIENIYEDESSALNMKKQFVSSFAASFSNQWHGDQCLNEFPKIVESLLTFEELRILKQRLLASYEIVTASAHFWRNFEEKHVRSFLSMCLEDDAKVEEYRALPIDDVFDYCIRRVRETGNFDPRRCLDLDKAFDDLDKCLLWHFGSVEEAKRYKIRRTHDFDNVLLRQLFRDLWSNLWRNCAERLFDKDEYEISVFRAKILEREMKARSAYSQSTSS